MWIVISSVLSVVLSTIALLVASFAAISASRAAASPQVKLHSVESRLGSLENSVPEIQAALTTISNSVKMARVRSAALHSVGSGGEPDVRTDPEAWRAWQNKQLRTGHGL
jgi:hypothetical protein